MQLTRIFVHFNLPGMNTPTSINGATAAGTGFRRDPSSEQQMRQAIRDLLASVDPYATLDAEAETVGHSL